MTPSELIEELRKMPDVDIRFWTIGDRMEEHVPNHWQISAYGDGEPYEVDMYFELREKPSSGWRFRQLPEPVERLNDDPVPG